MHHGVVDTMDRSARGAGERQDVIERAKSVPLFNGARTDGMIRIRLSRSSADGRATGRYKAEKCAASVRQPSERDQGVWGAHFPHRDAAMDLHRYLTHAKIAGNLLIHLSGCHSHHDLLFPRRQCGETIADASEIAVGGASPAGPRSIAIEAASIMSCSRNGFGRKSTAPAFIARTDIRTSPCPVIRTTGR